MKTKNILITILILLVIGVLAVLVINSSNKKVANDTMVPTETVAVSGAQCFYEATPTESGFNDVWSLKLNITGNRAVGEMAIIPAEKDSSRGTLDGTVTMTDEGYMVDAQFAYMIEGTTGVDQRIFNVTKDGVYFGYGELMEDENGAYQYKDPANLTYVGPVPQVACDSMSQ